LVAKKVKKTTKKKKSPQKKAAGKVSAKKTGKAAVTKTKKKTAQKTTRKKTTGGKAKTGKSGRLTPAEIEGFRRLLIEKWLELLGDVNQIESEALRKSRLDAAGDLSSMPIHMADLGTDNFEQEFALGLMDSERKILTEIRAALQRIEDGTYGICEGTGKPIAKARLKANPWARYCIEYARMVEEGRVIEGERVGPEDSEDEADSEDFLEEMDDLDMDDLPLDADEMFGEHVDDEDEAA